MKKLMKSLMLFAAAAMALTSCENEGINEGITENNTFTLSFTADVPQTRTSVAIDGTAANFAWSVDEEGNLTDRVIFLQTQEVNETVNTKYSNETKSTIADGVATFVTEFKTEEGATSYNYCAIYPETATSNPTSIESVKATLPASQTLTEGSYDPKADLMMSKLIEGVEAQNGHGGNLEFTRLAAIGKMALKGVTAGEEIQSVKLTFTDKVLNGAVTLDFINGTATYATEGNNNVEVKGALVAEASNDIFFTCFPGTYTGAYRVDVTTGVATYYKEGNLAKDLVFEAGNVTAFGATVGNRVASNQKTYTKVTNPNLADYSGNYLLVYEGGNVAFDGSLTTFDAVNNNFAVEISDNTITGAHAAKAFTIAKVDGGYSVQSASGYYIGQTSYNNDVVQSDETVYVNSITINSDGTANVACTTSGGDVTLKYNKASDQNRFRYYKSGQQSIALYRENGTGSDEELVLTLESIAVSGQTTKFTVGEEFVFDGTVTASYNNNSTAVVTDDAEVNYEDVDMTTAGEYTVTVTYEGKSFEYTVTVVNESTDDEPSTGGTFTETFANYSPSSIDSSYNLSGSFIGIENDVTWTYSGCGNPNQTDTDINNLASATEGLTCTKGITMGKNGTLSATIHGNVTSVSFYVLTSSSATCTVTITNGDSTNTQTIAKSTKNKVEITNLTGNSGSTTIAFKEASKKNRVTITQLTYTK